MTRRVLLIAAAAVTQLRGDAADDAWDTIASAARALGEATALEPPLRGTAASFLSFFDSKMPGFEDLRNHAEALIVQYDIQSTLDLEANDGDNTTRNVEVTWELRLADRADGLTVKRRQERVKCRVTKQGRKWKIADLTPLSIFTP